MVVTYLLEAMATGKRPVDDLADEKISLLRTYLYRDEKFYISSTVKAECSKIPDDEWRKCHVNLEDLLLEDALKPDIRAVEIRTNEYMQLHKGTQKRNDCRIVAEAELGGCKYLLTYDQALIKNLAGRPDGIRLLTPLAFWSSLDVPHGSNPVLKPHPTNPLSQETWWKW